jgi:hypothetical protein
MAPHEPSPHMKTLAEHIGVQPKIGTSGHHYIPGYFSAQGPYEIGGAHFMDLPDPRGGFRLHMAATSGFEPIRAVCDVGRVNPPHGQIWVRTEPSAKEKGKTTWYFHPK